MLATHRVQSIGAIYFEGEMAIDAHGVAQGRWAGKAHLEKRLGAADQTAFAGLMETIAVAEDHQFLRFRTEIRNLDENND